MNNSCNNFSQNKSICFFNSSKGWGGGEKWHFDIAVKLHNKGYKVIVITNKKSALYNKLLQSEIKTYAIKISKLSFLNPFKINKVSNLLNKEKTSTLIINLPSDLKLAAIAAKKIKIKKIIYRRGSAIPIKNKLLNRIIFKYFVDEIIANSKETKNTILLKNPLLFDKNKIKVIYNGLDTSTKPETSINLTYKKGPDEFVIGNAGRFVKQKNHYFLIKLAKELKKSGINFKIILGGEGYLKKDVEDFTKKLNVDDKIIFTGFVEQIDEFMNAIDLYILPSLWEGFGYVITEAMFYKKPVIAFNLSSNPEIIEDTKTGYLIEKNNLEEAIKKIKLLIENKELREKLGDRKSVV